MNFFANPFVAILDANVLYPFCVRDILLTFAKAGLFRARFTNDIVDEWTRSVIKNNPDKESSIRSQERVIREVFDECFVEGYRKLIPGLNLPDKDDCHVLAAAIKCSAQVIVTENLKDFPASILDDHGIEALSADEHLINTIDLFPIEGMRALRELRLSYENPQRNTSQFLVQLTKVGLPEFAAEIRTHIEFL